MLAGGTAIEFLLVQDDRVDELLMREEFALHKLVNRVFTVQDVAAAFAYLDGTAPFTRPGRPDLVLLDLNLPGAGGLAVLRRLRSQASTAEVPVMVLVDSPAAEQIVRAQDLPVQGYVTKPVDFVAVTEVVRSSATMAFEVLRR